MSANECDKLKSVASFFESNRNTEQIDRHIKRFKIFRLFD